ncbi:MAG: hypothetical protein R8K47_04160, partial [Mariprofundaceae bacterium]
APWTPDPTLRIQEQRRNLQLGRQLFGGVEPAIHRIGAAEDREEGGAYLGDEQVLMRAIAAMPADQTWNLIPPEDRGMMVQRRRLIAAAAALALFVCGLGGTWFYLQQRMTSVQAHLEQIDRLKQERVQVMREIRHIRQMQAFAMFMRRDGLLPARFMARAGNDLDERLVWRRFRATRAPDGLSFTMEGLAAAAPDAAARAIAAFEARLTGDPYRARVTDGWRRTWLADVERWTNLAEESRKMGIPFTLGGQANVR